MRLRGKVSIGVGTAVAALYLVNASWVVSAPRATTRVLAHRGIHQTFSQGALNRDTCTAKIIDTPSNPYLENTLPSMRASFAAGTDALEFDIHPTTDGEFAVFHDWTLDCRTNGQGVTRNQSMAYLRTLDVGYGYTADGGKTYPFRGKGVGLMPTLAQVLRTFPGRQFLINIKSNDRNEADRLIQYLRARGFPIDSSLWVFADGRPGERLAKIAPQARVMSKKRLKSCSIQYIALGWSGYVPAACKGDFIAIPINLASFFWGWPNRLASRMAKAHTEILIVAPTTTHKEGGLGIASISDLDAIPARFPAYIMTDNIETIGPAMRQRSGS